MPRRKSWLHQTRGNKVRKPATQKNALGAAIVAPVPAEAPAAEGPRSPERRGSARCGGASQPGAERILPLPVAASAENDPL